MLKGMLYLKKVIYFSLKIITIQLIKKFLSYFSLECVLYYFFDYKNIKNIIKLYLRPSNLKDPNMHSIDIAKIAT